MSISRSSTSEINKNPKSITSTSNSLNENKKKNSGSSIKSIDKDRKKTQIKVSYENISNKPESITNLCDKFWENNQVMVVDKYNIDKPASKYQSSDKDKIIKTTTQLKVQSKGNNMDKTPNIYKSSDKNKIKNTQVRTSSEDSVASKDKIKKKPQLKMKYEEYLKIWNDILQKAKVAHNNKWDKPKNKFEIDDFELIRTLGSGSFGKVVLAKKLSNESNQLKYFAIKILNKKHIIKLKQVEHVLNERNIMHSLDFPFLTKLAYSFKDNANLYLVLEFVNGGELFTYIRRKKRLKESQARFYIAQVILAIEYMHNLDILHRDLKPENTLIASDGYIKVSDFGFAKIVKTRTYTLCGTPEYLAPEIINSKGYGKAVDWWAVGVLMYEMVAGIPPFNNPNQSKLFEMILDGKYPKIKDSSVELKDLLSHMIQIDLTKRYGNLRNGVNDIKRHKWFESIDWLALYEKKVEVPDVYIPKTKGNHDASNFQIDSNDDLNYKPEESRVLLFEKEFQEF